MHLLEGLLSTAPVIGQGCLSEWGVVHVSAFSDVSRSYEKQLTTLIEQQVHLGSRGHIKHVTLDSNWKFDALHDRK